ncbi:Gfo/Idh/MocA family protein [Alteribacillus sp. HJP-4]|uniref:Gfo/Idh/MocA family protein n=1 Tax=Alteribacillus sp. HJP-4 TaxID=2775394 RepID=UPI0035CD1D98
MLSAAMLSRWHVHADDYAKEALEHPEINIVKIWDEKPERGQAWAEELGVEFEADLVTVLKNPEIDAVIVDTPTNLHKEVILEAAEHGKHIFSEKVLTLTSADCEEIFEKVKEKKVQLMLSLPRLSDPYYVYAEQVMEEGLIGKLTTIRCRLAHNGALPTSNNPDGWLPSHFFDKSACGGGALIDLGAHPIYLSNRLGGSVKNVSARLQTFLDSEVDDNSIVTIEYENGALGILEAGFVSEGSFILELHGTEGIYIVENGNVRLKSCRRTNNQWEDIMDLPPSGRSPMEQWCEAILHGTNPHITKEDMLLLTRLNEAASLADQEKRIVSL